MFECYYVWHVIFAILNESVYIVGIVSEKKKQSTLFKFGFSQTINDRETIDNIVANQLKNS